MAGPTLSILLAQIPVELESSAPTTWLKSLISDIDIKDASSFNVSDFDLDGIGYHGSSRPLLIEIVPRSDDKENLRENDAIDNAIGYRWSCELGFSMMSNRPEDRLLLGKLALIFSRRFRAWVDLGGPVPFGNYFEGDSWQVVENGIRGALVSQPGQIRTIEYEVNSNRKWFYHLVDADFLEGWIKHPKFCLVK